MKFFNFILISFSAIAAAPMGSEQDPQKFDAEEEKKKRRGYLRYNRGENGILGNKSEPELIEE